MRFKKLMLIFLTLFLLQESLYHVSAEKDPATASVNVSTVYVGDAITLRCDIDSEYDNANKVYDVYFITAGIDIAKYIITTSSTNKKEKTFETFISSTNLYLVKALQQENNINTTFEIAVITKTKFNTKYSCLVCNKSCFLSNNVFLISVIEKPLSLQPPTIISNVKHVKLNSPFILTCSLSTTFNVQNKTYSVRFYNNRDGFMANYDVDETGEALLSAKDNANVSVDAIEAVFPKFSLQIVEKNDPKLEYWCNFVDSKIHLSNNSLTWKSLDGPFLNFNSTTNGNERLGSCKIDEFDNHSQRSYEIQFFSTLGTNLGEYNLLGYYLFRPHRILEFFFESVPHWTLIFHGVSKAYPNFEIIAKVETGSNVSNYRWWCVVKIFELNSTRLIKSNFEQL